MCPSHNGHLRSAHTAFSSRLLADSASTVSISDDILAREQRVPPPAKPSRLCAARRASAVPLVGIELRVETSKPAAAEELTGSHSTTRLHWKPRKRSRCRQLSSSAFGSRRTKRVEQAAARHARERCQPAMSARVRLGGTSGRSPVHWDRPCGRLGSHGLATSAKSFYSKVTTVKR